MPGTARHALLGSRPNVARAGAVVAWCVMQKLRNGSSGEDVRRVQQALNRRMLFPNNQITKKRMARLREDGIFGNNTRNMVLEFQRINGIQQDGIVGPITSFLLLPFVSFTAELTGQGRVRGRRGEPELVGAAGRRLSVNRPVRGGLLAVGAGASKAKDSIGDGDDKDDPEDEETIADDISVSEGVKHEFKPWFVLTPEEPEGPKTSGTVTFEALILRKVGVDFSGVIDFSRKLPSTAGESWVWEGSVTGAYTEGPTIGGILSPLNLSASLKLAQSGAVGAGAGIEATIRLLKDTLELSVGAEISAGFDPHDGTVSVGGEVSGGLRVNTEFFRRRKKP